MTETITYNLPCIHRMPCGYCELKKENCNSWSKMTMPTDDQKWRITPTWTPNLNEVMCNDK